MNPAQITAMLKGYVIGVESLLELMDTMATPEYRALIDKKDLKHVENLHARTLAAAKALHEAMDRAARGSGEVTIQTGGGGK